jgi:hypothetical protein
MVVSAKAPFRGDELSSGAPRGVEPGTAIEVRTRFDGHWARGFEVVSLADDGYRVRRLSDGIELPTQIATQDVRLPRERKRGTWWY